MVISTTSQLNRLMISNELRAGVSVGCGSGSVLPSRGVLAAVSSVWQQPSVGGISRFPMLICNMIPAQYARNVRSSNSSLTPIGSIQTQQTFVG